MDQFTLTNPVFVTYVIAASLMVLKIMLQGWITVVRMMATDAGLVSPEDLKAGPVNRNPRPEQLQPNQDVERSRRIHRNDLENIPAFLPVARTAPSGSNSRPVVYKVKPLSHEFSYSSLRDVP